MYITKINGHQFAQYTIRVDLETAATLEQMAKDGGFESTNLLIDSMLYYIALDERTPAKFDKSKPVSDTLQQSSVASP